MQLLRARVFVLCAVPLFILIGLTSLPHPASAQDSKPVCDPAALIKKASALVTRNDAKVNMETLRKLDADIQAQNIACNGLTFTNSSSKLIGPFDLPKGNFKASLTTYGRLISHLNVLGGTCVPAKSEKSTTLFNISTGEATNGVDAVIRSEGCHAEIELDNVRVAFKLTIAPLEAADPSLKPQAQTQTQP